MIKHCYIICVKIYIPLLDGEREHWILAMINIVEKRWYYLDLLGPVDKEITLAYTSFVCEDL